MKYHYIINIIILNLYNNILLRFYCFSPEIIEVCSHYNNIRTMRLAKCQNIICRVYQTLTTGK